MKKKLRITVNGKVYDVVAELLSEDGIATSSVQPIVAAPAASAAAAATAAVPTPASSAPASGGGAGSIPSPLAGKIVSIDAAVGTQVSAGQTIITLEAMKMNTVVSAPTSGKITSVSVHAGDSVEEGQTLMTLE